MRIQNPEYDPWATVITMGTIKDDFSEYQVKYIRKLLDIKSYPHLQKKLIF